MIERKTWIGRFIVMYGIKREFYRFGIMKSVRQAMREASWWTADDKKRLKP